MRRLTSAGRSISTAVHISEGPARRRPALSIKKSSAAFTDPQLIAASTGVWAGALPAVSSPPFTSAPALKVGPNHLREPLRRRRHERGYPFAVHRIYRCPAVHQLLNHRLVAFHGREMEWRLHVDVRGLDIRAPVKEERYHLPLCSLNRQRHRRQSRVALTLQGRS